MLALIRSRSSPVVWAACSRVRQRQQHQAAAYRCFSTVPLAQRAAPVVHDGVLLVEPTSHQQHSDDGGGGSLAGATISGSVRALKIASLGDGLDNVHVDVRWLRDNCLCPKCLHTITKQRSVDTLKIEAATPIESATLSADSQNLVVHWAEQDGSSATHASEYPVSWLRALVRSSAQLVPGAVPAYQVPQIVERRHLWHAGFDVPKISAAEIMSDDGLRQWFRWMEQYGAALITGVAPNAQDAERITRRIAEPMQTIFGSFWDIQQQPNADLWEHFDTAYTNVALKAHTDCTYMYNTPFLQFFQIPERGGKGGETLMVDGFRVAQQLKARHPELYYYLSNHPMAFHYIEEDVVLRATTPVFTHNRATNDDELHIESLVQFRFNNDDRTPVYMDPDHAAVHYEALQRLMAIIRAPQNEIWMHLAPDELLCTNNWRVLHGRSAFSGPRRLMGCYISIEDYSRRVGELF